MNTDNNTSYTDIKSQTWFQRILPEKLWPYAYLMRLDRPIGWWLLLLPGWWSIVMASGGLFGMGVYSWILMVLFLIGAVVMRGAGCVINDLWDRELDKKVERTRARPLASGAVSVKQAVLFLGGLLLTGFIILVFMNPQTIILGIVVLPLIIMYPSMKRITYWPQAFLGITFNFGALMGWCAVAGGIDVAAVLLYIGGMCWTIGYDTIYAHQDKEDDIMAGIKSTALKFGTASKLWVGGFYTLAFLFFAEAYLLVQGINWTAALLVLPAAHLAWQLWRWDMDDQENSLVIFKSNRVFGLLFLAIALV